MCVSAHRSVRRGRQGLSGTRWRLLRDPAAPGPWNMAVDMALARTARPGEGVLRIYEWSRPTLSLGRNQPARSRFASSFSGPSEVGVVRRPTGGREVLHDRELTYAVVAPLGSGLSPRDLYRTISGAIVEALRSLDIPARLSLPRGRVPSLGSGPCFADPGADEIEVAGKKVAGSAQVRVGAFALQHGSLPLHPPTATIAGVGFGGVSVAEALGSPIPFNRVAAAMEEAFAAGLPGEWRRDEGRDEERQVAEALLGYYESPAWTWRR